MAKIVEIEGCGHAPALNVPNQIAIVSDFLQGWTFEGEVAWGTQSSRGVRRPRRLRTPT
jgi:hypothetical protein